MKILILGGHGRLASAIAREWRSRHVVSTLSRPEIDASNLTALAALLEQQDFDILVNGTGMTNVDRCETDRDEARTVNALAPGIMAASAQAKRARLIHFSTDYVFDGTKTSPYQEDDKPNPLGWYGQTKLDGERAVLEHGPAHLVIRVSWVFGPDKPSFIDAIIERARTNARVEAIADKFSSPTFACDVAGWLEPFFDPKLAGGIFHACNSGSCSWREYGEFALQYAYEAGVPLATATVEPLRLADMKSFAAPRPPHSALSTEKLFRATAIQPRSWQDAVRHYIFSHYAPIPPSA